MDLALFPYFLVSSILLTLAPGPDNLYLLAKSIADGAKAGITLAGGLASGIVFHTCLVILGVAAFVKKFTDCLYRFKICWCGVSVLSCLWCIYGQSCGYKNRFKYQ